MSITWRSPGRSATFSAKTSSSARSCSICSRASGRCTFTTTGSPVASVGAVHLGDRAGCQRRGVDVVEDVLPRHAELLLHHLHDLLLGERRHVVLQRRELLDVLRRQQVGPRRQDLPELRERRAELLEGGAQALALAAPADGALLVGPAEELLQPVLGEHGGDVAAARR